MLDERSRVIPHLSHLHDNSVSKLIPFGGLILTVACVVVALIRLYALEPFCVWYYGSSFTKLHDIQKRSFVNHHVSGLVKIVLLITAAYPFFAVVAGTSNLHSSFAGSKIVKMGDVLLIISEIFCVMYIFELFYRHSVSAISASHHIGAIVITQAAIVLGYSEDHKSDASIEFTLCLVWGTYDQFTTLRV